MTNTKKQYIRPARLADLGNYGGTPAVTVRFVPEPKVTGEHSLAALDIARNYDALPDMEQGRLGDFVQTAWERQSGTEEEQKEACRRFERLDWLTYVVKLRHEGWTLTDLCKHMGETEAEIQSLAGITEAVEAWLQSEHQRRAEREDKREAPENGPVKNGPVEASAPEVSPEALAAANVFGLFSGHVGTPGLAYLTEFFAGNDYDFGDANWIADSLNSGSIIACPRCRFLRLRQRPFPLDSVLAKRIEDGHSAPPLDDCDVCAFLPESCRLQLVPQEVGKALALAAEDLAEQRAKRAKLLYELYMGQADGADALLWARMADALEGVRTLPQAQSI